LTLRLSDTVFQATTWLLFLMLWSSVPECLSQPRRANRLEWPIYEGDAAGSHYSRLTQINRSNVQRLKVAWTYNADDKRDDNRSQIQCNPIVVKGVLYGTSPHLKVFALDAATGRRLWQFDPFATSSDKGNPGVNRGVVYWEDGAERRILFTAGPRLYAVTAGTGKLIESFGSGGSVDLREGLGREAKKLFVNSRTPGAIYRDLLILGTVVSEGPGPSAPGHIRAYDVRTGKVRWIFHTIPHPGEFGYETWPKDAWRRIGGANAWSGITVDEQRGLVFLPTGSAAFDFWGGNRHGVNLFANCIIALKAATGERVWHYQAVHHDIWDRDLPAAPNLVTVVHGARRIDAVAQITKSGHVFLLDRQTGKPLFPVEERPMPTSDLNGEAAWPTQPIPLKPPPFTRQAFTEEDVTDISPESRAHVLERLRKLKTGGPFTPPSTDGTVIFPGFDGGGEWGGAAFDPETGLLYVNANEMPWILTMIDISGGGGASSDRGLRIYRQHCSTCHGLKREGDLQQGFPKLTELAEKMSQTDIARVIEDGRGFMPSFRFLSNSEQEAVINFVLGRSSNSDEKEIEPDVPYSHTGYNRFLDPQGYPAVKPPWGTMSAVDLNSGTIAWTVRLGEFPELTKRGIPQTGTENYGGPIVTAGGLVFIGATKDEKFHAFDKSTGKLLWETKLPAGGYATPSTYEANGKQYVVIAAGGGKMGTPSGDAYVAFGLSER
jgi:quinoprotein glucose dehydrogenase